MCIRVYPSPNLDAISAFTTELRVAKWICTFASLPHVQSIAIEQRHPTLDNLPYVCLEEVRQDVLERLPDLTSNESRRLHIQVFSQVLFPRNQ